MHARQHVYMRVRLYVQRHVRMELYMRVRLCVYMHARLCVYACTSVRLYACTPVLLYGCTSVPMYVCTYVRIYSCTAKGSKPQGRLRLLRRSLQEWLGQFQGDGKQFATRLFKRPDAGSGRSLLLFESNVTTPYVRRALRAQGTQA